MAWIQMASHTDGNARLCCLSNRFIKDETGEYYNLGKSTIDSIFNSNDYQNIRKDMLEGKLVNGCETCYEAEKYSKSSHRINFIEKWKNNKSLLRKLNQSLENKKIDDTVEFFDIRFGNLCNLSCRYCFSSVSTTYSKEAKNINEKHNKTIFVSLDEDYNSWYNTKIFNDNIYKQIPNLEKYYAAGGEPTLAEKNYEFMEYMVDTGHSNHIELQISTNLTNTNKNFYSLLPHFKRVNLLISIDGIGAIQEYVRYPSSWKQIESNLLKIISMDLPNLVIEFTPVVQKINLEYLVDLFDYAENINKTYNKNLINVTPIILTFPKYYDITYLPLEYKLHCLSLLNNWKSKIKYQKLPFHLKLKEIREKCNLDVDYKDNLDEFFKYTDIIDEHRQSHLKDVNPNLEKLRNK